VKEVEFHFNVPDKLAYSCRLLRKVYRSGITAVVVAESALLDELDLLLWRFSATEFLPHCMASANLSCLAATPVILTENPDACRAGSVLVNLGQKAPSDFARFERFIDVVSGKDDDRLQGRTRWKQYKDSGYTLKVYDASEIREPV
jgi:DNA polymerase III subunit chi